MAVLSRTHPGNPFGAGQRRLWRRFVALPRSYLSKNRLALQRRFLWPLLDDLVDETEILGHLGGQEHVAFQTVGTPAGLRDQLFKKSLAVTTLEPVKDPELLFSGIKGVESWRVEGPASYVLSVSEPKTAAPEVVRGLVHAGADVLTIGETQHSLEDVYLELIAEDVEAHKP